MRIIGMMGLPKAGKTTIARKAARELGYSVLNIDMVRTIANGGEYKRDPEAEEKTRVAVGWMVKSLELSNNATLIIDDCNLTVDQRAFIRTLSNDVAFYCCPATADTCAERARLTGDDALEAVIRELQAEYEPFTEEELKGQRSLGWVLDGMKQFAQ